MNAIGDKLIGNLKQNPLVLAVVIINVLFLGYVVREAGSSAERKDQLIAELARACAQKGH